MLMESKSTFLKSFGYAFEGIASAFKGRNFKIIVTSGVLAFIAAFIFQFSVSEWVLLILTIDVVITAELINTSIEAAVDLVSPEIREKAKIAKDVSVAGVLIASIFSVIIAAFLFLPKIF
jgi:diacylglycerol kinase